METERLEKTISVSELMEYMRQNDLVIVPRQKAEVEQLRERYLRQFKSLSYKQIADAELWGELTKEGVKARVRTYLERGELMEHEKFKKQNANYIHRSAVERIAKNEGVL